MDLILISTLSTKGSGRDHILPCSQRQALWPLSAYSEAALWPSSLTTDLLSRDSLAYQWIFQGAQISVPLDTSWGHWSQLWYLKQHYDSNLALLSYGMGPIFPEGGPVHLPDKSLPWTVGRISCSQTWLQFTFCGPWGTTLFQIHPSWLWPWRTWLHPGTI